VATQARLYLCFYSFENCVPHDANPDKMLIKCGCMLSQPSTVPEKVILALPLLMRMLTNIGTLKSGFRSSGLKAKVAPSLPKRTGCRAGCGVVEDDSTLV
jgi:hypothetical protein